MFRKAPVVILTLLIAFFFLLRLGVAATARLQSAEGTIKLKVGVIFKSGEVRPVARIDFCALSKDLDLISEEAARAMNLPAVEPFEEYVNKQTSASSELRAWIVKHNLRNFPSKNQSYNSRRILSEAEARHVTDDDLLNIPEFRDWLQDPNKQGVYRGSVPKYPKASGNASKDGKAMTDYRKTLVKRMVEREYLGTTKPSSWIASMIEDISQNRDKLCYNDEMTSRQKRIAEAGSLLAPKYAVKVVKTSLSGEAEITLPSGSYWLSNLVASSIGQSSILWNLKVVVEPEKTTTVELSNDNAKEIK